MRVSEKNSQDEKYSKKKVDVEKNYSIITWKSLIGKKVRIWYFDGTKIFCNVFTIAGVDNNTIFFSDGSGLSLDKYIRHEVVGNEQQ